MNTTSDDLQEIANEVLESIEAGGDYYDEYQEGFGGFVGYNLDALRNDFESQVEDMRDYSEPDEQDWSQLFGKIPSERHNLLIAQPSLVTMTELGTWIESNEERASRCVCSAAGISMTEDRSGPVVVIGLMGDSMEPEIFLVAESRQEAEKDWAAGWI